MDRIELEPFLKSSTIPQLTHANTQDSNLDKRKLLVFKVRVKWKIKNEFKIFE